MVGFILFFAYALLCIILLSLLYSVFKRVDLPREIKIAIIGIVIVLGVIYFIQAGYLPDIRSIR